MCCCNPPESPSMVQGPRTVTTAKVGQVIQDLRVICTPAQIVGIGLHGKTLWSCRERISSRIAVKAGSRLFASSEDESSATMSGAIQGRRSDD